MPDKRDLTSETPLGNWPGHKGAGGAKFALHVKIDRSYKLKVWVLSLAL